MLRVVPGPGGPTVRQTRRAKASSRLGAVFLMLLTGFSRQRSAVSQTPKHPNKTFWLTADR